MIQDRLRENIERTIDHPLSEEEFGLFSKFFFQKSFDKKAILAEEGKICKYVYFILKGSAYLYYLNNLGEKNVIQFAIEGHWITDHSSFFTQHSGMYYIETLEPTDVLIINRENYEKTCCANQLFERFFRILLQNAFIGLQNRVAKINSEDARFRYQEFSVKYPHFAQRIPQYLIASFLGIKPPSLSRIRKEIATHK